MRKAAFISGLIGALGALLLGIKWLADLDSDLGRAAQALVAGGIGGETAAELVGIKTATYLLIVCGLAGLVISFMVLSGKLKKEINAILFVIAAVLPLFFSANAVFGVPMVLAGILAFFTKPRAKAPAPAEW